MVTACQTNVLEQLSKQEYEKGLLPYNRKKLKYFLENRQLRDKTN